MDYSKIGANTTMFTLPVGYRPYNKNMVAGAICVDLMSGGANNMFDAVVINTDGTVSREATLAGIASQVGVCFLVFVTPSSRLKSPHKEP